MAENFFFRSCTDTLYAAVKASTESGTALATTAAARRIVQMPDEYLPPNPILFVQNLPDEITKEGLEKLFAPCVSFYFILHPFYPSPAGFLTFRSTLFLSFLYRQRLTLPFLPLYTGTQTCWKFVLFQDGKILPLSNFQTSHLLGWRGTPYTIPNLVSKKVKRWSWKLLLPKSNLSTFLFIPLSSTLFFFDEVGFERKTETRSRRGRTQTKRSVCCNSHCPKLSCSNMWFLRDLPTCGEWLRTLRGGETYLICLHFLVEQQRLVQHLAHKS